MSAPGGLRPQGTPTPENPSPAAELLVDSEALRQGPVSLPAPIMNTIVFNKLGGAVLFEDRGTPDRERGSRTFSGFLDNSHTGPEVDMPDGPPLKDNLSLRHRRTGARQNGGKVRHKRQALQDMARPLKQWLYKHRDNPYPTKTEKILLALGSQMTLVQVSNWFANARRRLKNTVRQPDLSWALRIKLYNKYVQGNAERLSVSSDGDSCSEDGENPPRNHMNEEGYSTPAHHTVIKGENSAIKAGGRPESRAAEDYVSPPKYKSSLLNRYLNDSLRHVMATSTAMMGKTRRRNHSGSFSSNEFEEELVSPSSSETEGTFVYRTGKELSQKCDDWKTSGSLEITFKDYYFPLGWKTRHSGHRIY
ncbi:homeobox protein Mohawk isoform X2 [Mus pahari]|uniref:homeobox protein Mohawk isoform X2 n=1 Tax=Mus pahari TaxID=10093 RepID=UPI001114B239|nr:homeobox protein Mohawk isoform X2 [Mus pahari]